jgi:hypothetical protein
VFLNFRELRNGEVQHSRTPIAQDRRRGISLSDGHSALVYADTRDHTGQIRSDVKDDISTILAEDLWRPGEGLGHRDGAKPIVELLLIPEELTLKLPNTRVKLFRCEADFC